MSASRPEPAPRGQSNPSQSDGWGSSDGGSNDRSTALETSTRPEPAPRSSNFEDGDGDSQSRGISASRPEPRPSSIGNTDNGNDSGGVKTSTGPMARPDDLGQTDNGDDNGSGSTPRPEPRPDDLVVNVSDSSSETTRPKARPDDLTINYSEDAEVGATPKPLARPDSMTVSVEGGDLRPMPRPDSVEVSEDVLRPMPRPDEVEVEGEALLRPMPRPESVEEGGIVDAITEYGYEFLTDWPVNIAQSTLVEAADKVLVPAIEGYTRNPFAKAGHLIADNSILGNYFYEPLNEAARGIYDSVGLVPVNEDVVGGPYQFADEGPSRPMPRPEPRKAESVSDLEYGSLTPTPDAPEEPLRPMPRPDGEVATASFGPSVTIPAEVVDYVLDIPTSTLASAAGTAIATPVTFGSTALSGGNPVVGFGLGALAYGTAANAAFEPVEAAVHGFYENAFGFDAKEVGKQDLTIDLSPALDAVTHDPEEDGPAEGMSDLEFGSLTPTPDAPEEPLRPMPRPEPREAESVSDLEFPNLTPNVPEEARQEPTPEQEQEPGIISSIVDFITNDPEEDGPAEGMSDLEFGSLTPTPDAPEEPLRPMPRQEQRVAEGMSDLEFPNLTPNVLEEARQEPTPDTPAVTGVNTASILGPRARPDDLADTQDDLGSTGPKARPQDLVTNGDASSLGPKARPDGLKAAMQERDEDADAPTPTGAETAGPSMPKLSMEPTEFDFEPMGQPNAAMEPGGSLSSISFPRNEIQREPEMDGDGEPPWWLLLQDDASSLEPPTFEDLAA